MGKFTIDKFCNSDFPFFMNMLPAQNNIARHEHDFTELVIISGGTGTHVVYDEEYPVSIGDVFVITGNLSHGYKDTKNLEVSNLLFAPDRLPIPHAYLTSLSGFYSLFKVEPKFRKKHAFRSKLKLSEDQLLIIRPMLIEMFNEIQGEAPGYKASITGIFTELLVFLARSYSDTHTSRESLDVSRLGQVISKIETNYKSDISLESLAQAAYMSKRTFIRYFKSVFDMSPIKYLNQVRISKAEEMLRNSNMSISEIALEAGFVDSNYFSRQFKKYKYMTPRQFRERFKIK